jgi:hypothetical protein
VLDGGYPLNQHNELVTDRLLQDVAGRIAGTLRDEDTVVRFGAGPMSQGVVDAFEVVEIDEQNGAHLAAPLVTGQRACSRRSWKSRRFGKPVSGSWCARARSRSCVRRRTPMSAMIDM